MNSTGVPRYCSVKSYYTKKMKFAW